MKREGDRRRRWRDSLVNRFHIVTTDRTVSRWKNSLPFRGGEPAKLVEGFLWNLLFDVKEFTEAPLSHLRCQLSTRHALRVP